MGEHASAQYDFHVSKTGGLLGWQPLTSPDLQRTTYFTKNQKLDFSRINIDSTSKKEGENKEEIEMQNDHDKVVELTVKAGSLEKKVGELDVEMNTNRKEIMSSLNAIRVDIASMRGEINTSFAKVGQDIQKESSATTRWSVGTITAFGLIIGALNVFGPSKGADAAVLAEIKKSNAEIANQMSQQNAALTALIAKMPKKP